MVHTQTRWYVEAKNSYSSLLDVKSNFLVVAQVEPAGGDQNANARLIAAAPDLLNAAKGIIEQLRAEFGSHFETAELEAAIEKAEPKNPSDWAVHPDTGRWYQISVHGAYAHASR